MEVGQVFPILLKRKKFGTIPCEQNMRAKLSILIIIGCCPHTEKSCTNYPYLSFVLMPPPTMRRAGSECGLCSFSLCFHKAGDGLLPCVHTMIQRMKRAARNVEAWIHTTHMPAAGITGYLTSSSLRLFRIPSVWQSEGF